MNSRSLGVAKHFLPPINHRAFRSTVILFITLALFTPLQTALSEDVFVSGSDGVLQLSANGEVIETFASEFRALSISFTPDGKLMALAVPKASRTLIVGLYKIDLSSGATEMLVENLEEHGCCGYLDPEDLVVAPSGAIYISFANVGAIVQYTPRGERIGRIVENHFGVRSPRIGPGGALYFASGSDGGSIWRLNLSNGALNPILLNSPSPHFVVNSHGELFTHRPRDPGNVHQLVRIRPGSEELEVVIESLPGVFIRFAFSSDDTLYYTDVLSGVRRFGADGAPLPSWNLHGQTLGLALRPEVIIPNEIDRNNDGVVEANDITLLSRAIHQEELSQDWDLNTDGEVSMQDLDVLLEQLLLSDFGDGNLDGAFDSGDLVDIQSAGQFEQGQREEASWTTGDFNGDHEVDTRDFVAAFSLGEYEASDRSE